MSRPVHDDGRRDGAERGDDYLWDREGEPDAEVARLEGELARHRWKGSAESLGELPPAEVQSAETSADAPAGTPSHAASWPPTALVRVAGLLTAAAMLFAVAVWWQQDHGAAFPSTARPDYRLVALEGGAFIEKSDARAPADGTRPQAGERLVVEAGARARLTVGDIGSVELEGGTTLRIEDAGPSEAEYLLFLERGTVRASIFAAPRVFQVGTPAGIAVDLGCIYETTVDASGDTVLHVVSGQVSFETAQRKVTVPSGARARAWPGIGPGTPVWDDAPDALVAAIEKLDAGDRDLDTVDAALAAARDDDSLTLWHLLAYADLAARDKVFDRLVAIAPAPNGVTRIGILAGDAAMMERWKDALGWSW